MSGKKRKSEKDWLKEIVLKEEDVMDLFGCSKSTIGRLRRAQEIPYSKVGGSYFYYPKALKKMLKDRMVWHKPPTPPKPPTT